MASERRAGEVEMLLIGLARVVYDIALDSRVIVRWLVSVNGLRSAAGSSHGTHLVNYALELVLSSSLPLHICWVRFDGWAYAVARAEGYDFVSLLYVV